MIYTEEEAQRIAGMYNIPAQTVLTWKHRGKIPDKYFKPDFTLTEKLNAADADRLLTVISNEKLNKSVFSETTKVPRLTDILRKKVAPTAAEYKQIKTRLNEIRIEAQRIVDSWGKSQAVTEQKLSELKKFLKKNREIVIMHTFVDKKLIDFRNGAAVAVTHQDYRTAIDRLTLFCLETRL